MPLDLLAISILLAAASGVPGLFVPSGSAWGQRIATLLVCTGAALGLAGAGMGLFAAEAAPRFLPWMAASAALSGGDALVRVDALSAFFLFCVFLVGALGSVYGLGYRPQAARPRGAKKTQFFWGTLVAGMALLVIARQALAFIFGWEAMALSAFFLVSADHGDEETRQAGLVYLLATHVCTLLLFGMFALWRESTGSFLLAPIAPGSVPLASVNAIFFLAFAAFGMKAGMMPLHFWLPGAHANAPSDVSAMLSGVMLKMGIYGLLRVLSLLPGPPALWGWLILASGAASALLGVAFALAQHDLKRLLAYHSVENIGIILMGLGIAMLGRSYARPDLAALGMAGCLLHVWNHCLFKSLLFLGAGSVLRGAGTRSIDRLGGLSKRMPWTALFFLVGAVAISGLPPLNGFVSELLVYLGLFRAFVLPGSGGAIAILAAPALAMVGALALACFVKVYGVVFLGEPRTEASLRAREAGPSMLLPMAVLAVLCLAIGLAPAAFATFVQRAVEAWYPGAARIDVPAGPAPLGFLGIVSPVLLGACLLFFFAAGLLSRGKSPRAPTWDCGYAKPDARMQYTASSFARSIVGYFSWALRPEDRDPGLEGSFPAPSSLESRVDELVLDRALIPGFRSLKERFGWFRRFQQGQTQNYILFVFIALAILLLSLVPFGALLERIFSG